MKQRGIDENENIKSHWTLLFLVWSRNVIGTDY